jgi:hypothetical protein
MKDIRTILLDHRNEQFKLLAFAARCMNRTPLYSEYLVVPYKDAPIVDLASDVARAALDATADYKAERAHQIDDLKEIFGEDFGGSASA